jgi:hypothetical protein
MEYNGIRCWGCGFVGDVLGSLNLHVIRGSKVQTLSKIALHKPADFSYECFLKYRNLNPKYCAEKASNRFGKPSFSLNGPKGSKVEGWLLSIGDGTEIIYMESWPWEPSFYVFTNGSSIIMDRLLDWLHCETPDLHVIKGGKS